MKAVKITFWISTVFIFLFEGVMPAFTSQTEMAKEGIRHLGYPAYFGLWLAIFKVCGALVLIIPTLSVRLKEWAYAGLAYDLIGALYSNIVVGPVSAQMLFMLIWVVPFIVSYIYFHKRLRGI
jgi:hypothetical protein